jgi:uncharacterized phage protein (TIGR02220 family)
MTFIIKNWDENFEIAESRRYKKNKWIPLPNKMDGLSYLKLSKHKNKNEIFSCWILLIQLASKMPKRGVLENETGPLDFDDFEIMTGFSQNSFKRAIDFLKGPKIAWIEETGQTQSDPRVGSGLATTTVHNTTVHNTTVHNTTEQDNTIQTGIVKYLNQIVGSNYKPNIGKTKLLINTRLKEGFTFDNFKTVIFKKSAEWKGTDQEKYLRPETLFGSKFEGYLNQTGTFNKPSVPAHMQEQEEMIQWALEQQRDV